MISSDQYGFNWDNRARESKSKKRKFNGSEDEVIEDVKDNRGGKKADKKVVENKEDIAEVEGVEKEEEKQPDRERYQTLKVGDFAAVGPPGSTSYERPFSIARVTEIDRKMQTAMIKWYCPSGKDPYTCKYHPWVQHGIKLQEIDLDNIIFHFPKLVHAGYAWKLGKEVAKQIKLRWEDRPWNIPSSEMEDYDYDDDDE